MVVRFGVEAPALATLHDNAVRIMMGHVDQQLRLARAAAIGFVATAFTRRRSGRVLQHFGAFVPVMFVSFYFSGWAALVAVPTVRLPSNFSRCTSTFLIRFQCYHACM